MTSEKDIVLGSVVPTAAPFSLVPRTIKALDRLVGAGVDIPVAWLEGFATRIRSKTHGQITVEDAIIKKAAAHASDDRAIVESAAEILVRKEYRRLSNKQCIASEAETILNQVYDDDVDDNQIDVDDDWLNVFERYAEDASSERMQKLWARVLAGEIRRPGRYSLRTLRFVSEFDQEDATVFSEFCKNCLNDTAPKKLVLPAEEGDIRHLIRLEAAGLITGASGMGLSMKLSFDSTGHAKIMERNVGLVVRGEPNSSVQFEAIGLTPLGVELVQLIPGRDVVNSVRAVGSAIRTSAITAGFVGHVQGSYISFIEQLWLDSAAID